jgi:hypothetical protein
MATTFTHIATTELTSTQSSVAFESLGAYTDLRFYVHWATSGAQYVGMQTGSGSYTTSGYGTQVLELNGEGFKYASAPELRVGYHTPINGLQGFGVFEMFQYRNTNVNKLVYGINFHNTTNGGITTSINPTNSAIDRVRFLCEFGGSGNLVSGTKISVYGILKA